MCNYMLNVHVGRDNVYLNLLSIMCMFCIAVLQYSYKHAGSIEVSYAYIHTLQPKSSLVVNTSLYISVGFFLIITTSIYIYIYIYIYTHTHIRVELLECYLLSYVLYYVALSYSFQVDRLLYFVTRPWGLNYLNPKFCFLNPCYEAI